jgi:hypothetical protein
MIGLALFAFAWAVVRASVQAVTGDEAGTYVFFVARHDPYQWLPAANNHVLNSLLMRGFVSVFGLSHLTVRAPALIGALLYIAAAFWLSKLVSFRWSVRLPLFVCLVYNPFIFDFLVAARGYGMASAFLMWAIAFPAWCYLDPGAASPKRLTLACSSASACLALSFAASFTFAFVNTLSLLALLLWAHRAAPAVRRRLLAAAILPGLALTVLLPSYTLLHWPKGQLFFGGTSLWETITSVIQASLYQLNPHLLNPLLYPVLLKTRNFLVPTICGIAVFEACLLLFRRWRPGDDGRRHRRFLSPDPLVVSPRVRSAPARRPHRHLPRSPLHAGRRRPRLGHVPLPRGRNSAASPYGDAVCVGVLLRFLPAPDIFQGMAIPGGCQESL